MKSAPLLAVNFILCIAMTFSCTSFFDKRPAGVVIERNKESRPAWADSPSDRLTSHNNETRFHYANLKQRDLPIAVKQSQTLAIGNSYQYWFPTFEKKISENATVQKLKSVPKLRQDVEENIQRISMKIHSEVAQVEDIYYEKIRIDTPSAVQELQGVSEYFDVHTLVKIGELDQEKALANLGEQFEKSKFPELKTAGKTLNPSINSAVEPKKRTKR